MVVQQNLKDFLDDFLTPLTYQPFITPRRGDPDGHMTVQKNINEFLRAQGRLDINLPYAPRRTDPNGSQVVQKNLDYMVSKL